MLIRSWYQLAIAALVVGCQPAVMFSAHADSTAAAPTALKSMLAKIDTAANQRKLPELLRYYSPNYD